MGVSLVMTVDSLAVLCPAAWKGPSWRPGSLPDLQTVLVRPLLSQWETTDKTLKATSENEICTKGKGKAVPSLV